MRVLVPTADYPPIEGGIATVAVQVARELTALGHEVTVVAPWFPNMETFDDAEPVRVLRFRGYHWGWLRVLPMGWCTWRELKNTDLVLAINVSHGGLIARAARAWRSTPYLTFAYAYEFLKFTSAPFARRMLLNVYRNANVTVAISNFTRQRLEQFGVPPEKIAVVFPGGAFGKLGTDPNGATLCASDSTKGAAPCRPHLQVGPSPMSKPSVSQGSHLEMGPTGSGTGIAPSRSGTRLLESVTDFPTPFILAVGRFMPRKGQLTLVRAMPKILEAHPEVHLVLAGRGPSLAQCEAEIRALGLQERVHCPGFVDEDRLAALYAECALFALPTGEEDGGQVEGFGLVFAEAHAYGKAVVAGRSGGVEDAVRHEETGLLVTPEDPEETARAIVDLLSHPDKAQCMGEAGQRRVQEELNWRVFTQRLLEAAGVEHS